MKQDDKVSAVSADYGSGLSTFRYSFDGKNWFDYVNHKSITLKNGDSVTFRAVDAVGNATEKRYDYNLINYNMLKNYNTLASSEVLNDPVGSDIMKGLLA